MRWAGRVSSAPITPGRYALLAVVAYVGNFRCGTYSISTRGDLTERGIEGCIVDILLESFMGGLTEW